MRHIVRLMILGIMSVTFCACTGTDRDTTGNSSGAAGTAATEKNRDASRPAAGASNGSQGTNGTSPGAGNNK